MHDIKSIRENPDAFDRALARRGLPAESKRLLAIDERRRAVIGKLEHVQARRNAASKEIGEAKKTKDEAAAAKLMAEAGYKIIGIAEVDGGLYNKNGIDLEALWNFREREGAIHGFPGAEAYDPAEL